MLPTEIGNCKSLQTLILNHNQLTIIPREWASLSSLQTFHADNNLIAGDFLLSLFIFFLLFLSLLLSFTPFSPSLLSFSLYFLLLLTHTKGSH
jgi:Leucine-rich repeat (LRR) protein